MIFKLRLRSFILFFLYLLVSLIITFMFATVTLVYSDEEPHAWIEVGRGSASGGGISDNELSSWGPSLAISQDRTPIVAWVNDTNGAQEIYVRRWDGESWGEMGNGSASGDGISDSGGHYPSLAIGPDGNPIVAWVNFWTGDDEIYVRRWDGTSWVEMGSNSASGGGISDNDSSSGNPSLAIGPDGKPIVAWADKGQIFVRRWDGTSWVEMGGGSASGGGITNNTGETGSSNPSLAISTDGTPMVAWQTNPFPPLDNTEIHLRQWDGKSWVEMGSGSASGGGISDNESQSLFPSLAIDPSGKPVVAWEDYARDRRRQIYIRRWDGTSWVEMGSGSANGNGISNTSGNSFGPSLEISPSGTPIVAWHGSSGGYSEIYVRHWDGTSWVEMGAGSASEGGISNNEMASDNPSLAINPDGDPFVAWNDYSSKNVEIYVRGWQHYTLPTSDFLGTPTEGGLPLGVTFTNLSDGNYEKCLWDFGDGVLSTDCDDPSHSYFKAGSFTVRLTVELFDHVDTMTKTDYIIIHEPPTADFSASPTSGAPPLVVNFSNLSSGEYDRCAWSFGDGANSNDCKDPTHTYSIPGNFQVSLTVSGPGGENTKTKKDFIQVIEENHWIFMPSVWGD